MKIQLFIIIVILFFILFYIHYFCNNEHFTFTTPALPPIEINVPDSFFPILQQSISKMSQNIPSNTTQ